VQKEICKVQITRRDGWRAVWKRRSNKLLIARIAFKLILNAGNFSL
jgi:hypothetical protein